MKVSELTEIVERLLCKCKDEEVSCIHFIGKAYNEVNAEIQVIYVKDGLLTEDVYKIEG